MLRNLLFLILYIAIQPLTSYAEGGVEMLKNNCNNFGFLQIWDNGDVNRPFASYNAPVDYRLNVRVNIGDTIYFGFGGTFDNSNVAVTDVWVRLKGPNGNIVVPAYQLTGNKNTAGFINECARLMNGPFSTNGYKPSSFIATTKGDYYFEFAINNDPSIKVKRVIPWYDVTVKNGNIKKGRLWSKAWDLTTNSATNEFKADMYVYSEDSVVTKLNFNGIQPYGFIISCNSYGSSDVGSLLQRRKSDYRQNIFNNGGVPGKPEYPIFVNDPDSTFFPSGQIGAVDSINIAGCNWGGNCLYVYANKAGQAEVLLTFPNKTEQRFLEDVVSGQNCVWWDGYDGNGNYLNTNDTVHISVKYTTGITHLPMIDVEHHINGFSVEVVRPNKKNNGMSLPPPAIFWDDELLTDPEKSNDGVSNLEGCIASGGCHRWQNRGINNSNPEVINTWWYINLEKTTYTVHCPFVLDVDLNNFSGNIKNGHIEITWETSKEENLDVFELEKSIDGTNFELLGVIDASNKPSSYTFEDDQIAPLQYYRLKYLHSDGSEEYSNVIYIRSGSLKNNFSWNQVERTFKVSTLMDVFFDYFIYDLYGRLIYKDSGRSNTNISMPEVSGFILFNYMIEGEENHNTVKMMLR